MKKYNCYSRVAMAIVFSITASLIMCLHFWLRQNYPVQEQNDGWAVFLAMLTGVMTTLGVHDLFIKYCEGREREYLFKNALVIDSRKIIPQNGIYYAQFVCIYGESPIFRMCYATLDSAKMEANWYNFEGQSFLFSRADTASELLKACTDMDATFYEPLRKGCFLVYDSSKAADRICLHPASSQIKHSKNVKVVPPAPSTEVCALA